MRLLIMTSVSFDTVIWPFITSCTRSLSQTFPLVRSSGLCPMRPSSAMRSRRLRGSAAVSTVGWVSVVGLGSACISGTLLLSSVDSGFRAGLAQHILILNHFLQEIVQLLVTDETAAEVRQAVAQFEQFAKRRDLMSDSGRLKIVHALEIQFDIELGIVLVETIRHFESQSWTDFLHDVVHV